MIGSPHLVFTRTNCRHAAPLPVHRHELLLRFGGAAEKPWLRGKPVAVVPVLADTTSCIAARMKPRRSACGPARRSETRRLCPGIRFIKKATIAATSRCTTASWMRGSCIPIPRSLGGRMTARRSGPNEARAMGTWRTRIKAAIYARMATTCCPSASPRMNSRQDRRGHEKPNGLTVPRMRTSRRQLHGSSHDFPAWRSEWSVVPPAASSRCLTAAAAATLVGGSRNLGEKWHRLLRSDDVVEKATHHGPWATARAAARLRTAEGLWRAGAAGPQSRGPWQIGY